MLLFCFCICFVLRITYCATLSAGLQGWVIGIVSQLPEDRRLIKPSQFCVTNPSGITGQGHTDGVWALGQHMHAWRTGEKNVPRKGFGLLYCKSYVYYKLASPRKKIVWPAFVARLLTPRSRKSGHGLLLGCRSPLDGGHEKKTFLMLFLLKNREIIV